MEIDIHTVKPGDKDYPLSMAHVPFAEKYNLISFDGLVCVPLFQVVNAISGPNGYIIRNGIKCCPTCKRPADDSYEEKNGNE